MGLVRVEGREIVDRRYGLIRPPRAAMPFSWIHGIRWSDVCDQPTFGEVWPGMADILDDADFLVAHNAGFDRKVLTSCCAKAGLASPALPWRCTVRTARDVLRIRPANLKNVCRVLGIALRHHHALSDAEACARIALAGARAETA